MQAIILAGGSSTRLRPVSAGMPKPMLPLFDLPVLEHTVRLLKSHHITDIIICTSREMTDMVDYFGDGSRWNVNIRYSIEHEPRGTAGAVKLVSRMIEGAFLVISGDAITDMDLSKAIAMHWSTSALATLLLDQAAEPTQYGVVQREYSGRITHFHEKPRTSELRGSTVSTGMYILEPDVLAGIPPDMPCDFALHIFPRMLRNQEPIYGFNLGGYWCDAGDLGSYRHAHSDALAGRLKLDLPAGQTSEGTWMGDGARVHRSVEIHPPVYIASGANIKRGVVLRPNTVVGCESIIEEGAELSGCVIGSRSDVGKGAFIKDSIIGMISSVPNDERLVNKFIINDASYLTETETDETRPVIRKPRARSRARVNAEIEAAFQRL